MGKNRRIKIHTQLSNTAFKNIPTRALIHTHTHERPPAFPQCSAALSLYESSLHVILFSAAIRQAVSRPQDSCADVLALGHHTHTDTHTHTGQAECRQVL